MTAGTGLLVLTNDRAGGRRRAAGRDRALRVLEAGGPLERASPANERELNETLDSLGDRTLVVAGGDGSVHVVLERLWRRGQLGHVALGLVPLGTGNDLARALGVPLDPAEAASAVLTGAPRRLDLMVDGDRGVAANAAHAGVGAQAAAMASGLKGLLGPLAYPLGAMTTGMRARGWDLEVVVDGDAMVAAGQPRLLLVGIGNGSCIGGGTALFPGADPGDGLVDVVSLRAGARPARLGLAAAVRRGRHLNRTEVSHRRGRHVSVGGATVPWNVDGELLPEAAGRRYRVAPAAWTLLCRAGRGAGP